MLYTKKGDNGTSGLFGSKNRLPKNSPIYEALGTIDELNSLIGLCRASVCANPQGLSPILTAEVLPELFKVQENLFIIQAELAGAEKAISSEEVCRIEKTIDCIEKMISPPHAFVIPGTTAVSAWCDYIRTVARRAERTVISVQPVKILSIPTMTYLNRLSSLLYALARYSASVEQVSEASPTYANTKH